jgi:hypothetical protein
MFAKFTLIAHYTTALVENVNKRLPDVEVLTKLELFNPLLLPDTNSTQFMSINCYVHRYGIQSFQHIVF